MFWNVAICRSATDAFPFDQSSAEIYTFFVALTLLSAMDQTSLLDADTVWREAVMRLYSAIIVDDNYCSFVENHRTYEESRTPATRRR
jgi:hypothetical protein